MLHAFCTNWGERIILHISRYSESPISEKALNTGYFILFESVPVNFWLVYHWHRVYDDTGLNRIRGRDSDFFVLHQRCIFYNLTSPIEVKKTYAQLIHSNKKHIDLNRVFSKVIIQNGVFEGRYRTTDLDSVSQTLLGVGKYGKLNAGTSDITSLSLEEQMRYVRRDSELAMLLAQYNSCLALRIMNFLLSILRWIII